MLSQLAAHRYEAALLGWSGRPDPDGNIYNNFVTGAGQNRAAYSNAKFDDLLNAARILTSVEHRKRAYAGALTIMNEDLPYLFLYWPKEYKVLSPKVQGFVHNGDGMIRLRSVWLSP
jgi:peptide/nickel transport system substrate-binding protein